jgi:sec-independent protein translocase protein TatC
MVKLDDPAVRAQFEENLPRMSFGDHLDELRRRVVRALLAVFVAVMVVIPFKEQVQGIITEPYRAQWRTGFEGWIGELEAKEKLGRFAGDSPADPKGKGFLAECRRYREVILDGTYEYPHRIADDTGYPVPYTLMATGGLDDMWVYMMASLVFSLVLAAPVVGWQIWAFVAAGLYPQERRVFLRYFPAMVLLSAAGVLFGYFVALPYSLGFLISLMPRDQVSSMLSVSQYFTLLFALTAAMGVVFQLPTVMVALQRVGLVTHAAYVKHWRITVLLIFVVAAVFTPPEPVSMMLVSAPMIVLYGLGLLLTRAGRRREATAVVPA